MHVLLWLSIFCLSRCLTVSGAVSQTELNALFARLWMLDRKEMRTFVGFNLRAQGRITYMDEVSDVAPQRLFSWIDLRRLRTKPTIQAFISLMNNYIMEVGTDETTTREEEVEIDHFLDEVIKTDVMNEAHKFLTRLRLSPSSIFQFKEQLRDLWFRFYRRKSKQDSSAFEHVFVGETKQHQVSGYHNWIKFALDEADNQINYRGHFTQTCGSPPGVFSLSFRTKSGALKPKGTIFIGTSPEFEMAIYTVAFLSGVSNQRVNLGTCSIGITCHRIGPKMMGSCFVKN